MNKFFAAVGGALSFVALTGGLYLNSQRDALMEKAVTFIEEKAEEKLGTKITIGDVTIDKLFFNSGITVRDVELFDKKSERIAKVDEAKIKFKLFNFVDEGAGAIDEIDINGAEFNLKKRSDETWNVEDINIESEGESTFDAKITLTDGTFNAEADGKKISAEEISGDADCADMDAIKTNVNAKVSGSAIQASGTVGSEIQIIKASSDKIDISNFVYLIPEGILPEEVKILGGTVSDPKFNLLHRGAILEYSGEGELQNGSVQVMDTLIEKIDGTATFANKGVNLSATAEANGQKAKAYGTIRLDTDSPFFNIHAESESFNPSVIIPALGIDGAAKFTAHLTGTAQNPEVDGDIYSDLITYENISARNVKTHLQYFDDAVYLSDLSAEIFGGEVEGSATLFANDLSYNAEIKATALDLSDLDEFAGTGIGAGGKIFADVNLNGVGADFDKLQVYGTANGANINYGDFQINTADTSFYLNGKNLTVDTFNAKLPYRGTLGLKGTLTDGNKIDMEFFGSHLDLAMLKSLNENFDASGLTDFTGEIHGDTNNPQLALKLGAVDSVQNGGEHFKGTLFKQPFDSLTLKASGSFDGINLDVFEVEQGGKIIWRSLGGTVGLTGEKKINLKLETNRARVENIVALVAPDLEFTGNIDNTVTIIGTLDNPRAAGHVQFKYGSFRGVLISGMEGDYFLNGAFLALKNFEITSPMIDMNIDGTINTKTGELNFVAVGHDLDLLRVQKKFPEGYETEGHGKFNGLITGTVDAPNFEGTLDAENLSFNGVQITNVHGQINVFGGNHIVLRDFSFNQGEGSYKMYLTANTANRNLNGNIEVKNVDIPELFLLANKNSGPVAGKLNSKITAGGTIDNPSLYATGDITDGELAGYDLHDVNFDVRLLNKIIYVEKLEGKQGEGGFFSAVGQTDLDKNINFSFSAKKIDLGMIGAVAGIDMEFVGEANLDAMINGDFKNPQGQAVLTASGGLKGSTFDLLTANIFLKDRVIDVQQMRAERMIGTTNYAVDLSGRIPIVALTSEPDAKLDASNQLNLKLSFDNADLSLLPVIDENISWAVGEIDGGVTITGTAKNPQIHGSFAVNDGAIKTKLMTNLIEHINFSAQFKGTDFVLEHCTGNVGSGNFNISGGFNFAKLVLSGYNLNLVAENLEIQSAAFTGPLNAEFSVTEEEHNRPRPGGIFVKEVLPKISGHIDFDNCIFSVPNIPDSESELPDFLMDVSVNLGDKVHFYSSRLYDMYLSGSVRFEGISRFPNPSGSIIVKRGGTITYTSNIFDIREGEAYFNQQGSFFPTISFAADTRVGNTKIYLRIDGTLQNMSMRLWSSPEMSQTEIFKLLTLRGSYDRNKDSVSAADILTIGLQMSVLADIEDSVKRTLGLDKFIIARGTGSAFDTYDQDENKRQNEFNVSIGKYVTDKIMLRLTQGINGDRITRYGIQYDLNENLSFTLEQERNQLIVGVEARYRF